VGRKELHIGMQQLANRLNASRLGVSRALHTLENQGLLVLSREKIEIPFAERLLEKIF
jgi:DNA-binding IclR family transcriptional regulator